MSVEMICYLKLKLQQCVVVYMIATINYLLFLVGKIMDVKDCLKRALDAFNPNHKIVEQAKTRQSDIWQKKKRVDVPPLLLIAQPREEDKKIFVEFPLDEAIYSSEKMLLNQLAIMQRAAIAESDAVPSCRANMGCGIFASIL